MLVHHRAFFDKKSRMCYLPIAKCANSTFSKFFVDCGWKEVPFLDLPVEDVRCFFGFIRNPRERFLQGLVQMLYQREDLLDDEIAQNLIKSARYDLHIIPIRYILGDRNVYFMPMDYAIYKPNLLLNLFLENHEIDYKIDEKAYINRSITNPKKIRVRKELNELFGLSSEPLRGSEELQLIMKDYKVDFDLYVKSISNAINLVDK